ncbi:GNAT family N-acetyltransferase [Nonomuraea sp. NPDC050556]|uniref:GNAT family N-acetyltransferase n=1 Tax=Nonomuraea sp. NPDC050556 TaxID=3364369 RepID=UPI00378766DA
METLTEIFANVANGSFPELPGTVTVVGQPSPRDLGVLALTGHSVIFADLDPAWVLAQLPDDDLSAPLGPRFLRALEIETGRHVDNVDLLMVATPLLEGDVPLTEVVDHGHPRVVRARSYRDDVRVWTCDGGMVTVGRGVAGRWEVAVEVDETHHGRGLGRTLAKAARGHVGEPLWAQIAPGNAASVRAFLAAGFQPVGAEALLVT